MIYQRAAGSFPLRLSRSGSLAANLQEPDISAVISADRTVLRLYSVNSTPEARTVGYALDSALGSVASARSFVVTDTQSPAESEAMNSRDASYRISQKERILPVHGKKVTLRFEPFSVTLVELRLQKRQAPQ